MLSRVLVATFVAIAAGSASAADMPFRAPPATYGRPAFSWSGFYAGMNAGYGWGKQTIGSITPSGGGATTCSLVSPDCKLPLRGTTVGATVGFNIQSGAVVFGVESDLNYADFTASLPVFGGDEFDGKVQWFGTLRGRLGFAYGALMPYLTGGLYLQHAIGAYTVPAIFSGSQSNTSLGWTIGGGVEYALSNSWSVKAEYLYARVDNASFKIAGFGSLDVKGTQNIVRAGLNYRY